MSKTVKDMQKALVPKLRFSIFKQSGEWIFVRLDKLAKRRSEKNRGGKLTRVLTNSAEFGVVDQRDFFDKEIATQGNLESYCVVEKGDFVYNPRVSKLASVGPISKNELATGVMSPLYTVFRFDSQDNDFYKYYFSSTGWHKYMRQVSSSGARHDRMAISTDDFNGIPLPVSPDRKEQQKIANCLSSIDTLISAQADKLEALKIHKKGLMQQLFPQEGETIPRLRFPEFKDSGEWNSKKLGDLCIMQAGKFITASEITDTPESDFYPCYGGNGLRGYTKIFNQSGRYSLIGRQGALCGNVNLVEGDFYATEHAIVVTPKNMVETTWLFYNLCFLNLNQFATGQAQPGLSVEVLEKVECSLPKNKSEQKEIADCLSSLDTLIAAEAEKLEALKTHKTGLMQQLFPVLAESEA